MSETCLIVKYCGTFTNFDEEIEKCFILDETYAKKFMANPIESFEVIVPINCYNYDTVEIAKYFVKEITKEAYEIIKDLELTDDATELFELLDKN